MPEPQDAVSAEAEDGEVLEQAEGGNIAEIAAEESATTELALTEAGVASGDRPEAEVSPQTPATPDLSPIWAVSPPAPEGSEEVAATDSSSAVVAPSPAPLEPVEDIVPALEAAGATAAGSATAEVVPAAASLDAGPSTEAANGGDWRRESRTRAFRALHRLRSSACRSGRRN